MYPNFTIGIYGEWGTGKTTLLNLIKQELELDNNMKTVWFDAWKYEREEQFALIPSLKTINFSLEEDEKYKNLKDALKEAAIFILGVSKDITSSTVTTYVDNSLGG